MALRIDSLRCEYADDPLGIDEPSPRLSWLLASDRRATLQTAYRIQVAAGREDLGSERNLRWDSGEVASDRSTQVAYRGEELASFDRCCWRVRVRDNHGCESPWSEPAFWEMGILEPSTWRAEWITPDLDERETDNPCPMLRKEFALAQPVRSARAYVTSLGLYELTLNGRRVGDRRLTPGFTSFHERLHYQVYDVGEHLRAGDNAIGVTLADGWYRGPLWVRAHPNVFGRQLALLAEIRVEYADGSRTVVASDDSWRCATGPLLSSDLYFGEVYDARRELAGWSQAGFADGPSWRRVKPFDGRKEHLCCARRPPVRVMEAIHPQKIFTTPRGELVADLGRVIAGTVRLELTGESGREVRLGFCEQLTPDGNFNIEQLDLLGQQKRSGRYYQIDRYVLAGGGPEIFEPRFTFHGFRYVKLENYPGALTSDALTALVLHSDLPETGRFACSNPLLDQLQQNIVASQKGNFLEIPTDCPQREKMGWTGDIQIYAPTACFLMESAGFLAEWLRDLALDQREDGMVPHVVPWLPDYPVFPLMGEGGSAAWGDACTVVPWNLYLYYGDERVLRDMYAVMKRWLAFIDSRARNFIWSRGMHWGDWLEPGRKPYTYFLPWAKKGHVATPYWAQSVELTAEVATRLGEDADAEHYRALAASIKQAYQRKYLRRGGRLAPSTQGAYVLALAFDMVPPELAPALAARLADLVRKNGNRLSTGFSSTAHLCHVLCRYGYADVAFDLLNQEGIPSWLYQVKRGATTIWETWDAVGADGRLQQGMSFNHYAFGAIGDWLYRYVAGIRPDAAAPGFKHSILAPHPGGGIDAVRASHRSPYGEVAVAWKQTGDVLTVEVRVPANTTATLQLPGAAASRIEEGGEPLERSQGVSDVRDEEAGARLTLGSGCFVFRYPIGAEAITSRAT